MQDDLQTRNAGRSRQAIGADALAAGGNLVGSKAGSGALPHGGDLSPAQPMPAFFHRAHGHRSSRGWQIGCVAAPVDAGYHEGFPEVPVQIRIAEQTPHGHAP